MTAARNYRKVSVEIRAAAVKHVHTLVDEGCSETEACRALSAQIGVHGNSVRNWAAPHRGAAGSARGSGPTEPGAGGSERRPHRTAETLRRNPATVLSSAATSPGRMAE